MGCGVRQGRTESMLLFVQAVAEAVEGLLQSWRSRGWGVTIGVLRLALMGFADDLVLVATLMTQAQLMLVGLCEALARIRLIVNFWEV